MIISSAFLYLLTFSAGYFLLFFVFMIMLGAKENSHHFFSSFKRTFILAFNNQFKNLLMQILAEKGA
jgi:hypothetical protein